MRKKEAEMRVLETKVATRVRTNTYWLHFFGTDSPNKLVNGFDTLMPFLT